MNTKIRNHLKSDRIFADSGKLSRLLLATGLSALILTACSQAEASKPDPKPSDSATITQEVTENKSEPKDQEMKPEKPEEKQEEIKADQGEEKASPKEEEAVKNKDHVPMDTPDNVSEQRMILIPDTDISKELTPELLESLKDVSFADFNLDQNNPQQIKDIDSLFVLANKANFFPEDYKPKNLVVPDIPFSFSGENEKKYLQKPAADAIALLIKGASSEGIAISGVSGYRSIARQKVIYKYNVDTYGQAHADKYSAKPRYSEHHTGLCMDVSSSSVNFGLVEKYGETKEGKWLAANAHKYGFVIRYPKGKEHLTGYSYEPWHIRYLGVDLAGFLYQNGLCYEEFVAGMQKINVEPATPQKPNTDETEKTEAAEEKPGEAKEETADRQDSSDSQTNSDTDAPSETTEPNNRQENNDSHQDGEAKEANENSGNE